MEYKKELQKLIEKANFVYTEFAEEYNYYLDRLEVYPNSTYRQPILYLYYDIAGNIELSVFHKLNYPIDCDTPIKEYEFYQVSREKLLNDIKELIEQP